MNYLSWNRASDRRLEKGSVAGALLVSGFSIQVKDFGKSIIDDLEASGWDLHFDSKVISISAQGGDRVNVEHAVSADDFDYVFVSSGAHGREISRDRRSEDLVQAVVGAWSRCVNEGTPLTRAIKLSRDGLLSSTVAEGANIVPERPS
jgi:L-2-hydroxyglutarate oxidase LhgO